MKVTKEEIKHYLDILYYKIGRQNTNFKVSRYNRYNDRFDKWQTYLDWATTREIMPNQRTLLNNEIVIDIDKPGIYHRILQCIQLYKLYYFAYQTVDGRSRHIHMYVKGLDSLNMWARKDVRRAIIKKFMGDTMLSSDNHMIQMEYTQHWKTKGYKNLIDYRKGWNTLAGIRKITN